jgi:serine/threonine-protein kinase
MAPEQAEGNSRETGPAADLYALGAILYELLTGRPPFRAESAAATVQLVLSEDPVPPSRLNPQVPRDLETICLKCLHKDPRRRYATAGAVADDLYRFLQDQPIAARPVGRLERALRWIRRNLTATALIVTAALLLGLAGAAGLREWGLVMRRRAELEQWSERLALVIGVQERGRFDEARGILQQPDAGTSHLRTQIAQARANLNLVERLEAIRLSRGYVIQGDIIDYAQSCRRYVAAFRQLGLGELREDPDRVAARLNTSPVHMALVAALDDWAVCAEQEEREWVLRVARRMDPDPWRDRVQDPDGWARLERFPELADMASVEQQPVTLMVAFGTRWRRLGGDPTAFLERVQRQHPDDFWVNFELGHLFGERDLAVSIGYFRAAQALRPHAAVVQTKLGYELTKQGQLENEIHHFKRAVRFKPNGAWTWDDLGSALLANGLSLIFAPISVAAFKYIPPSARGCGRPVLLAPQRGGQRRHVPGPGPRVAARTFPHGARAGFSTLLTLQRPHSSSRPEPSTSSRRVTRERRRRWPCRRCPTSTSSKRFHWPTSMSSGCSACWLWHSCFLFRL